MKTVVSTTNAPEAIGPYSQGIKANGFLFLSGQIPLNSESGRIEAVDMVGQTRQVMENIQAVLGSQGLLFSDVVKTTIFLTNLDDFTRVNEIYGAYFKEDPPARSTVQVAGLPKGAKVEIEVVAALP
jgi:2-iminobutanoate/2-iminopropanoate deaminase